MMDLSSPFCAVREPTPLLVFVPWESLFLLGFSHQQTKKKKEACSPSSLSSLVPKEKKKEKAAKGFCLLPFDPSFFVLSKAIKS